MNAEMVARIIQTIIAPVVMISACAITLTGLLSHYAAINDRLRRMGRERLDLLRVRAADTIGRERLAEVDAQLPELLRRLKMMRNAVLSIYSSILLLIVDMLVIALAAVTEMVWLSTLVMVVFLLGMAALLIGVLITAVEIRSSHRAIQYEVQHVLSLGK